MELEYLLIYQDNGIPIYSRCFASACKTAMGNDVLFSAFLASLNTFAKYDPESLPQQLDLDGTIVTVDFNAEDGTNSVKLEELQLLFFYGDLEGVTIAAGFNSDKYDRSTATPIFNQFMHDVEVFMEGHKNTDWTDVTNDQLLVFEAKLLSKVVTPFFKKHGIEDNCAMGDNCPYRIAMYESDEKSMVDRLRSTIQRYRDMSMFSKIKAMMFGSKWKLPSVA